MNIEAEIPELLNTVVCYCNANNRGALSADMLRSIGYKMLNSSLLVLQPIMLIAAQKALRTNKVILK